MHILQAMHFYKTYVFFVFVLNKSSQRNILRNYTFYIHESFDNIKIKTAKMLQ